MLTTLYLFLSVVDYGLVNENDTLEDKLFKYSLTGISLVLFGYQIFVEVNQFSSIKLSLIHI